MFIRDFNESKISELIHTNKYLVPIIDTIIINDFLFGRLDIILNKYYRGKKEYIPLFMDFNNITDPTDLNIGRLIEIPDFDALIEYSEKNKIFEDDRIPGVSISMDSNVVNNQIVSQDKTKTTALPKLKITLPKASYDSTTGIIKY